MNRLLLYVDEQMSSKDALDSTSFKISEFINKYVDDNELKTIEVTLIASLGYKGVVDVFEDLSNKCKARIILNIFAVRNPFEMNEYEPSASCFGEFNTVGKGEEVFKKEGYYGVYKRLVNNSDGYIHVKGPKSKQIVDKLDHYATLYGKLAAIL